LNLTATRVELNVCRYYSIHSQSVEVSSKIIINLDQKLFVFSSMKSDWVKIIAYGLYGEMDKSCLYLEKVIVLEYFSIN